MHILLKFSMLMKTAPKHWKNKQNHVSKIVNGTQAGENFELNLAFLIWNELLIVSALLQLFNLGLEY